MTITMPLYKSKPAKNSGNNKEERAPDEIEREIKHLDEVLCVIRAQMDRCIEARKLIWRAHRLVTRGWLPHETDDKLSTDGDKTIPVTILVGNCGYIDIDDYRIFERQILDSDDNVDAVIKTISWLVESLEQNYFEIIDEKKKLESDLTQINAQSPKHMHGLDKLLKLDDSCGAISDKYIAGGD